MDTLRDGWNPQEYPVQYCPSRDRDRDSDLNDAFRDPGVRAVIATRGGRAPTAAPTALTRRRVRRPETHVGADLG